MSAKATIFHDDESGTSLFEEVSLDEGEHPVFFKVTNPMGCSVICEEGTVYGELYLDPKVMDQIALIWCQHRGLRASGGYVEEEDGSY